MTALHVLGMAFSELTRDWSQCAFTQRTFDFCNMMQEQGFDVFAYGGEQHELDVTEHVTCLTREDQHGFWPDYEPKRDVFNSFDPSDIGWKAWNARAAFEIEKRQQPGDILCITMGTAHRPVAELLPGLFHVETGIGYSGVWAPYRIYESWAWRNYITGKYGPTDDVRFYDTVLPRAYPAEDFPEGTGDGGYFLYLGRVTPRKGVGIAAEACQRIGARLVVAGQGEMDLPGDVEFLGTVDAEKRAELLGGAIATFCPSIYLEPFCGVSVESQLCGTPVIAANWGGLVENVGEGSGLLCDTLAEFCTAAETAPALDRSAIRKKAHERWTTEALGPKYLAYFERLLTLQGEGWYS
jgi:glycosyltransferase involved in cell wall biosynthesis